MNFKNQSIDSSQSLYQGFLKINSELTQQFLLKFNTEPISISFDRQTHKKVIYTQTDITMKYEHNKWDSKFMVCG